MGEKIKIKNIIFDLDGTIIDSAEGINSAFKNAYQQLYNVETVQNIKSMIGPPIKEIFIKASGETDTGKIDTFVKLFQKYYDEVFYTETLIYNHLTDLLGFLKLNGISCFVATNKRLKPTMLILNQLNLTSYFKNIYTIDGIDGGHVNKIEMVKELLKNESLAAFETMLIGDTHEDFAAAQANKLDFIYADYGYGNMINVEKKLTDYLTNNNYKKIIH